MLWGRKLIFAAAGCPFVVIASEAKQSSLRRRTGLLRRFRSSQ
jgi:hypothetical protein